jgi:uncharacterized protein (DUF2141 family)
MIRGLLRLRPGPTLTILAKEHHAMKTMLSTALTAAVLAAAATAMSAAAAAPAYHQKISNEPGRCAGDGSAVKVNISGIKPAQGILRVQLYRATAADWLQTGRWLNRIEVPARSGSATVCMPVPGPGTYGIAVRHDVNGNGKTDIRTDGGGMSNNPSINILNLGKPSYKQTAFPVGSGIKTISIQMRYF